MMGKRIVVLANVCLVGVLVMHFEKRVKEMEGQIARLEARVVEDAQVVVESTPDLPFEVKSFSIPAEFSPPARIELCERNPFVLTEERSTLMREAVPQKVTPSRVIESWDGDAPHDLFLYKNNV